MITIRIAEEEEDIEISTGNQVGVSLKVIKNPLTQSLRCYVALGKKVCCYSIPCGEAIGEVDVGDNVNAVAINPMANQVAAGCDGGLIKVYEIIDDSKISSDPLYVCEGHEKAVCAISFSPRENRMVSSAKDGTARVWKDDQPVGVLTCSIKDPKAPPPKRSQQVLVRGCDFGDINGDLIYTVASGRRGRAFLSKWAFEAGEYRCIERTACSDFPISAMSLSGDAGLMVLGSVNGTIILWGIERWKPMKSFPEVHDLPVTCIAARPFPVPLKGDEDGIQMHAISASADSQLAWLSLQRASRQRSSSSGSFTGFVNSTLKFAIVAWLLYPIGVEIWDKCEDEWDNYGYMKAWECIHHDVLVAPNSRPGIMVAPY